MTTFTPIDMASWPRRDYFYYFTKMMPTGFSVTADLDITATYKLTKQYRYHFFAVYLYIVTKLISEQPNFMVAEQDGVIGQYDVLTPAYSIFHDDDHSISGMWTALQPSLAAFHADYLTDMTMYQNSHGPVVKDAPQPANSYMIGMLPQLHFTNYTPLTFNGLPSFFPTIQAGQYQDHDARKVMPLSFTIHHAVADGFHVSHIYEELQTAFNHPEEWFN
ncbi:CatA-like O-acetyltransferase [Lacticaseibacillus saniviri]